MKHDRFMGRIMLIISAATIAIVLGNTIISEVFQCQEIAFLTVVGTASAFLAGHDLAK